MATDRLQEDISADIPESLAEADALLSRYAIWATRSSRGGRPHTLDRQYIREGYTSRRELMEAAMSQREMLMPTLEAMDVQRALARVPAQERIVLSILYVPKRDSENKRFHPAEQLRVMHIPPRLSRERHLAGLRMFWNIYRTSAGKR